MEKEVYSPVIYIFINKSLNMTTGKASAQAAHAAVYSVMSSLSDDIDKWDDSVHRTIIVLEARDETHMENIKSYLNDREFFMNKIVDEGVNEIDPHTITALSSSILNKNDKRVIDAFSTFSLYREKIKVSFEFER